MEGYQMEDHGQGATGREGRHHDNGNEDNDLVAPDLVKSL